MCGITGFVDYRKLISEQHLLNASAALRHRGGNGFGHIYEEQEKFNIGLANERLATIDISNNGLQPFTSSCGQYTITFNGTIYNYKELRNTLVKCDVAFRTHSDTEVLIECYKKWGHQLFEKIDGVFAFAILDRKQQQLFLARDTMGVKPLYFYKNQNFFAFSSELKGLLSYPIEKSTNANALEKYLRYGYFHGNETIFKNILNFRKQHYFIINLESYSTLENKFKNAPVLYEPTDNKIAILKKTHDLIKESVLGRNVTDVNAGVMLSGGYDSATVAAILQRYQDKKTRTFTLGFKNKKIDEAPAASMIAKYLETDHNEYYIDNIEATSILENMPQIFDEPMGDSGAIPLAFLVSQIAKKDINVLLGAEGGDELFAGYTNYKKAIWLHQKARPLPIFLKNCFIRLSKNRQNKLQEIFETENLIDTYISLTSFFTIREINTLMNKEVAFSIDYETNDGIKSLLDFDKENYLPNDLLLKSDRITMHYGIDNRDALLKIDLANFLKKVDEKWFMKEGQLKYLLKEITHQYIPKKLMDRPKKGFSIPILEWMNTIYRPYLEEYLSPEQLNKHHFFDTLEILKIKNRFYINPSGGDARKLWLLLQFQMWYNKHFN